MLGKLSQAGFRPVRQFDDTDTLGKLSQAGFRPVRQFDDTDTVHS